ncbi:hypothetical protein AAG906_034917 [Vitis piasezkii]
MSLSGAAQRWFASVEPSRLRTWEDVAREFARRPVGIPFRILGVWFMLAFGVEEAMARGLWMISPARHSAYRPPTVRAPFSLPQYQYQLDYAQEPYIAQTSMQLRPPHPRAATHPPPRPYAQRPPRQFTPLGMTLTRAFEKLRDAGVIVPLAPRPLPHPIPPHFRSHEHCLYHRFGHDRRCSRLHHAI